jgi:hypothetical protein
MAWIYLTTVGGDETLVNMDNIFRVMDCGGYRRLKSIVSDKDGPRSVDVTETLAQIREKIAGQEMSLVLEE